MTSYLKYQQGLALSSPSEKPCRREGGTLTLQHIETDASQFIDVGVEDLGKEADLGRCHGVVVREKELKLEHAACDMSARLLQELEGPAMAAQRLTRTLVW